MAGLAGLVEGWREEQQLSSLQGGGFPLASSWNCSGQKIGLETARTFRQISYRTSGRYPCNYRMDGMGTGFRLENMEWRSPETSQEYGSSQGHAITNLCLYLPAPTCIPGGSPRTGITQWVRTCLALEKRSSPWHGIILPLPLKIGRTLSASSIHSISLEYYTSSSSQGHHACYYPFFTCTHYFFCSLQTRKFWVRNVFTSKPWMGSWNRWIGMKSPSDKPPARQILYVQPQLHA